MILVLFFFFALKGIRYIPPKMYLWNSVWFGFMAYQPL